MKRGFTIVELMMVIGILAVLMTIITTAATGAIKEARTNRANALVVAVQEGLNTYYAQKDDWPEPLRSKAISGSFSTNSDDPERYRLTDTEVDDLIYNMLKETVQANNPVLDITGLFVCNRSGANSANAAGMDFMEAAKGSRKNARKMKVSEMSFGYPDAEGKFKRFKIVYSIPADSITVSKQ